MTTRKVRTTRSVQELEVDECERLLAETPVGRLGFNFAGKPVVLPVNFRYMDGAVVFRTATGQKLHAVASGHAVAFEVDHWDDWNRVGWSVLITGHASEIEEWEEFQKAEDIGLHPWAEVEGQDRWVRIVPDKMTGRRIG